MCPTLWRIWQIAAVRLGIMLHNWILAQCATTIRRENIYTKTMYTKNPYRLFASYVHSFSDDLKLWQHWGLVITASLQSRDGHFQPSLPGSHKQSQWRSQQGRFTIMLENCSHCFFFQLLHCPTHAQPVLALSKPLLHPPMAPLIHYGTPHPIWHFCASCTVLTVLRLKLGLPGLLWLSDAITWNCALQAHHLATAIPVPIITITLGLLNL